MIELDEERIEDMRTPEQPTWQASPACQGQFRACRYRVEVLRFRVSGLRGLGASAFGGLWFRVWGLGFRVWVYGVVFLLGVVRVDVAVV